MKTFKVVDLFAGPGGLAEGFASFARGKQKPFQIALSVEKEATAFATLRLRSFFRQFKGKAPRAYYSYIAGEISRDDLIARYPDQWAAACEETDCLELGQPETNEKLDPVLDRIRSASDGNTVLIGGPPCQAYSLVGRARNQGIADYVASEDHRHFLYREYIRIIGKLKPAAFVMENVKGFLSAKVDGLSIFDQVMLDLTSAGGQENSYRILPLSMYAASGGGREHVLRSEQFGVPQRRHRVILFGVRSDIATGSAGLALSGHTMSPGPTQKSVRDVLKGMPKLRSTLSKHVDSSALWKSIVTHGFRTAAAACHAAEDEQLDSVAERLVSYAEKLEATRKLLPVRSSQPAAVSDPELSGWLSDPHLSFLPNHDTRGHMDEDLARYAFASVFGEIHGRSPKASDYPEALAPRHRNWTSGKFADRFRVQLWNEPATTVTSHISKDGHYFVHPDPMQCRSLTVREAARLQTFPDNYFFEGNRTEQYVQVGNAVPPYLARQIAATVYSILESN